MLVFSLNFWRRADSSYFVSHSATLIFHSKIKKTSRSSAMSPVNQYINILVITITFFPQIVWVLEVFSHSFLWGHFQLWLCYCSSICATRGTFHLCKLFQPITFQPFCFFSFWKKLVFSANSWPFSLANDTNICLTVCRAKQCTPLINCSLCRLQEVLLISAYIV